MGYKIQYGPTTKYEKKHIGNTKRYKVLLLCTVLVLAMFLIGFHTSGADSIRDIFLPGNAQVTEAAFADMSESIRQGQSIKDAFAVFCMEIIENAEIS